LYCNFEKIIFYFKQNCQGQLAVAESRLAMKKRFESVPVLDSNTELDIFKPKAKEIDVSKGLKKVVIGKSEKQFREKTILVVGATGTGKTTFLNSMVNYLYDVKQEDDFRFKIVTQADEGHEDAKSKTKQVSAYCFNDTKLPYRLVVVDTPGYGDTDGLMADKRTTGLIKNLFENQGKNRIDHLDAVCIVVKASDSRLTAQQRHNFNSVLQLFGKDVASNLFIIATFCDASEPPVKASLRAAEIDISKFSKFNNSAFFEGFLSKNEEEQEFQKFFWKAGQASFKNFFTELESTHPVSLALSAEVLQRRHELEALVLDLHKSVKRGLAHLEHLRQEALVMEKFEAQIKANKSFTYTIRQSKFVQEDISGNGVHTTTCLTCNFTCHSNCAFADDKDKARCVAMSDSGDCKVCPSNCRWDLHKNLPYIIKAIEEDVTKTDKDLRRKYLKASDNKKSKEMMLENLGQMFISQQKQNCQTITNIRETLQKLQVQLSLLFSAVVITYV
jgi:predicted GTPase